MHSFLILTNERVASLRVGHAMDEKKTVCNHIIFKQKKLCPKLELGMSPARDVQTTEVNLLYGEIFLLTK